MSKIDEITRDSWIMSTFPEWGTWLNEDIENEVVKPGTVAMWWLGCTGMWFKTPEDCNISVDLWCGNGKRTHGDGKMKVGHQMANMCGARAMQPNLRAVPFVLDPFAVKKVDAVLATHYHQDHMSAEYASHVIKSGLTTVNEKGEEIPVPFIGPAKSVALWQQWGVPAERCITVRPGDSIKIKDIEIIALDSFDRTCLVTTDSTGADREELTGKCPTDMDEKAVNYLIKTPGGNIYHSGDSHYSIYFAKHGKDYDIDVAFGSYGENPIGMAIILGAYWAVGSNLTIKPCQEITDGAGFCLAHQQMFGIALNAWLAEKFFNKKGKKSKRLDDIELPGFMSIFNENMVCTSILMLIFFGAILCILGRDYLVAQGFLEEGASMVFYVIQTCLYFSVYLAILQLGVRTFVTELTASFQGIADKLLPGSVPGVDCAVIFGFGSANAVPIGFLAGFVGQILAIAALILMKSPVLVICGFVPVFFDNATIGIFADAKGGFKAAIILPFLSGICQVFGSAMIAGWAGMAAYGGYLGMWDWAVVWPVMTVVMKFLGYIGVAVIAIGLLIIPQLQYRKDKEGYFMMTEDYEAYKKLKGIE